MAYRIERYTPTTIASMRPPEFTGGNAIRLSFLDRCRRSSNASMRPPEFTGGNVRDTVLDDSATAVMLQ